MVEFEIPGKLKGKGRPRFARQGRFVRAYTPAETVSAEAMVRTIAKAAIGSNPPMSGPLHLEIEMTASYPASWSRKRKARTRYVTGKPDADNLIKLLGDSCNGILWADDSQIACVTFVRVYDLAGDLTRVRVFELSKAGEVT